MNVFEDKELLVSVFTSSKSMKEALLQLGFKDNSSSYRRLKRAAETFQIELPKYDFKQAAKNLSGINTIPLEEILVENSTYTNRQSLKRKLIKAGLFEDRCNACGLTSEWNGKPLVLQIDHINGVGDDNRIENLAILCPNCHSQTDTFGNGNKIRYNYCDCGNKISKRSQKCVRCSNIERNTKRQKIQWPDMTKLLKMVDEFGYSETGRVLGVSDNAVRKHIRRRSTSE